MTSSRAKRALALSLVAAFMLMAFSPIFATAQTTVPGHQKSGPYVDKLVYSVITADDQQVLALQDDEIDLIGDMVDPSFLETLIEAENIDVETVVRNGYGLLDINCRDYPLNITALRRAIAFAVDKQKISDDVWDGLSQPQDSVIPVVNPGSIEGLMPYTYYEANVEYGKELLAAAGFEDTDDDGFLNAPNGDTFDILVEAAISSTIAQEVGQIVSDAIVLLGIDSESRPTDFYEYLTRLYFHGDYDMVFYGNSFTSFDLDWMAYEYWSENADVDYQNGPNFRNATFDGWRDQLLHATFWDGVGGVLEAAHEMQKILIYEVPRLIAYENIELSAFRTDKFEGYVNDISGGVPGWWTNQKIHMLDSLGGPFGGTFRVSNALDIDTFNFMVTSSSYSMRILGELYDSLIALDDESSNVLWLAESYTSETHDDNAAVPDGYTRLTFNMIQNATWTDGEPVTAEDAAFSMNYYRDTIGNPYGPDLSDMTAAYAPTTYTLVVEFDSESYWHTNTVGYKPIIPKHVFQEVGIDDWNIWSPDPPTDTMVTSGPFMVSDYLAGEFVELEYNPDYFYGLERPTEPPTTDTSTPPDFTMAIVAGAVGAAVVILVGGYVLMRQK